MMFYEGTLTESGLWAVKRKAPCWERPPSLQLCRKGGQRSPCVHLFSTWVVTSQQFTSEVFDCENYTCTSSKMIEGRTLSF